MSLARLASQRSCDEGLEAQLALQKRVQALFSLQQERGERPTEYPPPAIVSVKQSLWSLIVRQSAETIQKQAQTSSLSG